MRPEDILPDSSNEVSVAGISVRKGSIGAFVANARVLMDPGASGSAQSEAEAHLSQLVPALAALGLFDVFEVRDARVRLLVERFGPSRQPPANRGSPAGRPGGARD